jgi:hypothetical protein
VFVEAFEESVSERGWEEIDGFVGGEGDGVEVNDEGAWGWVSCCD